MLQLRQVRFDYGDASPFVFDFSLEHGKCLAIKGTSGSGKSTLLNLIAGFLKPATGQIFFSDQRIDQLKPAERPLTILFQEHNLFNHLTVFQNIALGLNPSLKLTNEQLDKIDAALGQLEISELRQRLPEDLSGGQRQRVALARCLVRSKPLLLLDEPFTGLNDELKQEIQQLVRELQGQLNLTILWVSHDMDDVKGIADHIANIENNTLKFVQL